MAEMFLPRSWRYRALFAGLALAVVFLHLLPVDMGLRGMPGPDLILAAAMAWVVRRPDYVPVLLIAAVVLVTDIVFLRPLGLWTALCVIGTERVRARVRIVRDPSFFGEWGMVAATIAAMTLAHAAILALFGVIRPGVALTLAEMAATILVYPLVVAASVRFLGVRRRATTDPGGMRA